MILEYVRYKVPSERAADLVAAYTRAAAALRSSPHCLDFDLARASDDPASIVLRLAWDSAAGHMQGFRSSPAFRAFLADVRPFVGDIAEMRHYDPIPLETVTLATQIAPLACFVGTWRIKGTLTDGGKRTPIDARYHVAPDLGGAWLDARARLGGLTIREQLGFDPRTGTLVRHQFQSTGLSGTLHSTGWDDDTLVWEGTATPPGGVPIAVRSRQVRIGQDAFNVRWERHEGEEWIIYGEEELTRA
ncbi:MAG TPA: antibiotic biosynthesis monooxygenase family protein [Vicinamibacterales bacterium]